LNISERIADRYIDFIKKNDPDSSSREILKYALIPKINFLFGSCAVLIFCAFTGKFVDGLLAVAGFSILRNNSGGIHFRSQLLCVVVSVLMILAAVYSPLEFWYYGLIINCFSMVIIFIFSPSISKREEIKDKKLARKLKMISTLFVATNFLFQSHVLAAAFFIQALTTMKPVQICIDKLKL
jgi:accessory gene regulator B